MLRTACSFALLACCTLTAVACGGGAFTSSSDAGPSTDAGSSDAPNPSDAGPMLAVTLSTDTVHASLPPQFLGINYVAFRFPPTNQDWPASSANQGLARTPVAVVRFPGGVTSDFFDFRCPYYDPGTADTCPASPTATSYTNTSEGDLLRWLAPMKTADTVVLNQTNVFGSTGWKYAGIPLTMPAPPGQTTTPSEAAAVAAWAQANVAAGLKSYWEIGNEPDLVVHANSAPFSRYTDAFDAQAAAIHAADPGARVFGPALSQFSLPTATTDGTLDEFLGAITLSGLDGISLHWYSGLCLPAEQFWAQATAIPGAWASSQMAWVRRVAAKHGFGGPIAFTELALAPQACEKPGMLTAEQFNPTLGKALVNLDMIAALAASGVSYVQYFDVHGGAANQYATGVFYGRDDAYPQGGGVDAATPMLYALALWGAMGDQVVDCALPQGVAAADVSCWATKRSSDGGVQVLVVNKSATSYALQVSGFGARAHATRSTLASAAASPSWTDVDVLYDGAKDPPYTSPFPPPAVDPVDGATYTVTSPAYSAVVVSFD